MLLARERRHDHRNVQVVRRGVVDDVHLRIGDERLVAAVCLRHAERFGLSLRRSVAARGNRDDVDEAEAPDRVDMMSADETGADQAHSDPGHTSPSL